MTDATPKETHSGELKLGEMVIPCAVLNNGTRVLSQGGLTAQLGISLGGRRYKKKREEDGIAALPVFLAYEQLKPFLPKDIAESPLSPIIYTPKRGGRTALGIDARLIPVICEIWLKASDAGVLKEKSLQETAKKAGAIMRGLAHVGIVALVDEATSYQKDRDQEELQRLLAAYLSPERLKWAARFPSEFYTQIYRLWGWRPAQGTKRTPEVGKLTNKLVYDKLPPGVLEELKRRNPKAPGKPWRVAKHHQHLSDDLGQPDLHAHLLQLVAIMRISNTRREFERHFARAFPAANGTQQELFTDGEDGADPIPQ